MGGTAHESTWAVGSHGAATHCLGGVTHSPLIHRAMPGMASHCTGRVPQIGAINTQLLDNHELITRSIDLHSSHPRIEQAWLSRRPSADASVVACQPEMTQRAPCVRGAGRRCDACACIHSKVPGAGLFLTLLLRATAETERFLPSRSRGRG